MSGKGCGDRGEDNKGRLSPLLSFWGSTVFLDLHNERRIREALAREDMVFRKYQAVHIDASFPAESMYLKRGYRIKTYEKIETGGGDYLCYHTMEKAANGKG